jgi:hypothetical protein
MMTASEATRLPRFVIDRRLGNTPIRRVTTEVEELVQIPGSVRNCVVFLYYDRNDGRGPRPAGTAFFVRAGEGACHILSDFIVTARHVIDAIKNQGCDEVIIRANLQSGGSDFIRTEIGHWHPHSDPDVDVSVFYAPLLAGSDIFAEPIPTSNMLTRENLRELNVRFGEDVFLTGLFRQHLGKRHMVPVIRTGSLASDPDPELEERIPLREDGREYEIDGYLIETKSIGGLSGSPVFFEPGTHRWLITSEGPNPTKLVAMAVPESYWLGLIHGHWDVRSSIGEDMNTGMAIVVPAEKVIEVLGQDDVAKDCVQTRTERYGEVALDSATGEQPFSDSDFNAALRKVSRRKPSGPEKAS